MADNPMLKQLKGEYERNSHFASLADSVAEEIIGCSFAEGMNAHPDASCSESRWLGSMKRLVCQAIFKMYGGPPAKSFDPKLFLRAQREMEPYATQVQGFHLKDPENMTRVHVVRDYSLPVDKEVARFAEDRAKMEESPEAAKAECDRCHQLMMDAIEERKIQMAWTHYLWGTTSGAFDKPEES